MTSIFFYGSLRDRGLLEVVLGRDVDTADFELARVAGHAAYRIAGEDYPVLLQRPGARAEGVLFRSATAADIDRLSYFEEAEYRLVPISVETAAGNCEAEYFRGTEKPQALAEPWDFETWRRDHLAVAIETAREYMHHVETLPVEEIDTIWPGIKIRALQRARARSAEPRRAPHSGPRMWRSARRAVPIRAFWRCRS